MSTSDKRAYVSIYCKIYTENFSDEMIDRYATGKEIYNFLLRDAKCCLPLKGDCNLWYLGSNEKFGNIIYNDRVWHWGWGESSFDTVQEFIEAIYKDGLFTKGQYLKLLAKIEEGRTIGDMYQITDYLSGKNKPSTTTNTTKENNHVI
jgi:hypothetical protein